MSSLPEYENPPVVEVALAIEFAPLPGWDPIRYGSLWERFRKHYPITEVQPSAAQVPFVPGKQLIAFATEPPLRYLFKNELSSEFVQLRSGAFIKNWRAETGGIYPRYKNIRPAFERDWHIFIAYLDENTFKRPEVWKWEVTYVNHLYKGKDWISWSDVSSLVPGLVPDAKSSILGTLTQAQVACSFDLPSCDGRMDVQLTPALSPDGREVLQFSLTASGDPKGNSVEVLTSCLDRGRHAIVTGFSEFTSVEAQNALWRRKWQ